MEPPRSVGFSEQTDAYLRRVLLDRVFANEEVLFTKTFKPPFYVDELNPKRISAKVGTAGEVEDLPSLTRANWPFYLLLRFLGCVPYKLNARGDLKFQKTLLLYSVTIYGLFLYGIYYLAIPQVRLAGSLDLTVDSLTYFVILIKFAIIPFIMWLPYKRVGIFYKSTCKFHSNFFHLTGEKMTFDLEKYTPYIAVAIPISTSVIVFYFLSLNPSTVGSSTLVNVSKFFLYWIPYIVTLGLDFLWCTPLVILGKSAERLVASLKSQFEMEGKDWNRQEQLLREYRALWLDLSKALQHNNDVSTMTFTYHALHVFLMLTMNLFSLLNGLRSSWDVYQNLRLIAVLIFLTELWLMANAAHYCTTKFEDIQWDPFFLIPSIETTEAVRREMSTFLDVAVAAPHVVDIGGFVCINRSWLTNMLGNLLSSLIILLQFRVQQSAEDQPTLPPSTENFTTLVPRT